MNTLQRENMTMHLDAPTRPSKVIDIRPAVGENKNIPVAEVTSLPEYALYDPIEAQDSGPSDLNDEQRKNYADFYTKYIRNIERYVKYKLNGPMAADADDVIQEIMTANTVVLLATSPSAQADKGEESRIIGYLYRVAEHKVIDTYRAWSKRPWLMSAEDNEAHQDKYTDTALGPEAQTLQTASHKLLDNLLRERLSEEEYLIIYLRVVEGLSADDCAKLIGKSPNATRTMQSRALSRLRTEFAGERIISQSELNDKLASMAIQDVALDSTEPLDDDIDPVAVIRLITNEKVSASFLDEILEPEEISAVLLRVVENRPNKECAALLHVTTNHVTYLKSHALTKIHRALQFMQLHDPSEYQRIESLLDKSS